MKQIIRNQEVVDDSWVHLEDEAPLVPGQDIIVSWARFDKERDALLAHGGKVGVKLYSDDDARALEGALSALALIAIDFPKFTDGRGYSHARILRDQLGFEGELRAVGDVLQDQMFFMARCGINAFELKAGKSLQSALEAFSRFTVRYQAAADQPKPIYQQ